MDGKTVVLSVLIMSLVMAQIQVEAKKKSCCPNTTARNIYNPCRFMGTSQEKCAQLSGCKLVDNSPCPEGYTHDILENSGDAVCEFCKSGCESSVCAALTTLQNSDAASEIVNGAVAQCTNACSDFCTNGQVNAVETA